MAVHGGPLGGTMHTGALQAQANRCDQGRRRYTVQTTLRALHAQNHREAEYHYIRAGAAGRAGKSASTQISPAEEFSLGSLTSI